MKTLEVADHNASLVKWDNYFFNVCKTVAENSSCLSRKIGAVMVKDKSILSTGYNGPPRGIMMCDKRWGVDKAMCDVAGFDQDDLPEHIQGVCPRYVSDMGFSSGQGLEWCVAGHAERNALINAARAGQKTKNCKVYMDCGVPCTPCLVELINAGIEEIIITKFEFYDQSAQYLLEQTDMDVRLYTHCCTHNNIIPKSVLNYEKGGFCSDCGMYMGI
jgi:dCMP deaminase